MKTFFGALIVLFVVAGCSPSQIQTSPTASFQPPTATATLTSTPISTPSTTPSPTPLPLKLPVLNHTPVPLSDIPISVDNADKITELARYWGNPDSVVRISPDGKTLILANVEGIYFYDISSGELKRIVDRQIYFFYYDDWQPLATYLGHYLAISPDLERLAYFDNNLIVHVVDKEDKELFSLSLDDKNPDDIPRTNLEISPNGKILAITMAGSTQYGEKMLVYDIDSNKQLPVNDIATYACFTGDGGHLIVGPKKIYDTSSWKEISPLAIGFNTFDSFTCDPRSNQVAFLSNKRVEVWDIAARSSISSFLLPEELYANRNMLSYFPSELRFSMDGTKLFTFARYRAKYDRLTVAGLLEIESGRLIDVFDTSPFCGGTADCTLPSISVIENLTVTDHNKLTPITTGIDASSLPWLASVYGVSGNHEATNLDFLDKGRHSFVTIASHDSNFVCQIDLNNGTSACPYNMGYSGYIHLLANNEYYSYGSCEESLLKGLFGEGKKIVTIEPIPGCSDGLRFLGYSSTYNVVMYVAHYEFGTQGNKIFLYDIANNKYIDSWKYDFNNGYLSINRSYGIISPDGRYAAVLLDRGGTSDQVLVYDLSTKSLIANEIFKDEFENVGPSLSISTNEQKLVMLSPEFNPKKKSWNMSLHVLYLDGSSEPTQYDLPVAPTDLATRPLPAMGLAISPDASLIAVGLSNGALYIIDASTGELVRDFPAHQGHAGPIIRLAFNKGGSLLTSLERSGIVKLWGLAP